VAKISKFATSHHDNRSNDQIAISRLEKFLKIAKALEKDKK
jgi:hypothetical protein